MGYHEKWLPRLVPVDVENPNHVGVREPTDEMGLVDQVRDRPHRVLQIRSHALDGNQAMEPFPASDGGHEHLGLAARRSSGPAAARRTAKRCTSA
jgi:hypothetical protein